MMVVIQNAFANTSSSIMISKVQGNIVDTLMPPLSPGEILTGYVAGGVARGLVCAAAVMVVIFPWAGIWPASPLWMLWFALAASVILSLLGLLAGIWAEKFDQMAAITNFIVTPLSFLSGTFYSVQTLPPAFVTRAAPEPVLLPDRRVPARRARHGRRAPLDRLRRDADGRRGALAAGAALADRPATG